jgi:hypothetical protein
MTLYIFYTVLTRILWIAMAQLVFATGWTVRGSNPGGGEIFRTCPDQPWGPASLLYNWYRVSFPGVESGRSVTLTPHSLLVPKSKNSVELYLYPPFGPLWPVTDIDIDIFVNCSWVDTRWQYTFTHKQYIEHHI